MSKTATRTEEKTQFVDVKMRLSVLRVFVCFIFQSV